MFDAAQAGAWRVRGRWHRDHHPPLHIAHLGARYRRRQLRYALAREPPRQARRTRIDPMTSIDDVMIEITPQVLLKAYACGIFPMAESAEDNALYWIEPEHRGILPLDRAFFGESMFSRARDASKIALVYLVARLKYGGFTLLDTQFVTGHLARFGAIEGSRQSFQRLLEESLGTSQGSTPSSGSASAAGGGAGAASAGGGAGAGAGSASAA